MKNIDARSYALGVCDAFCEVVRAGVKRVALSHPFTDEELRTELGADFPEAAAEIAKKNGVKAYHLQEPVLTDLFPLSMNLGKQNIIFYRLEEDLEEMLAIQRDKNALQTAGKYDGEARREIAVRYGHVLSYSDEAIQRYLASNNEREA